MKQRQYNPLLNISAQRITAAAGVVRAAILGNGHVEKLEPNQFIMCKVVNSPVILAAYNYSQYNADLKAIETVCCFEIRVVSNSGMMQTIMSNTVGNVRETKAVDFAWTFMNYVLNLTGNPDCLRHLSENSRAQPYMKITECKPPRARRNKAQSKKLKVVTKSSTKKKAA